jgi:hypothetical protein
MICQRIARVGKVSVASTTETRNQPSWAFAISRPMAERETPRRARYRKSAETPRPSAVCQTRDLVLPADSGAGAEADVDEIEHLA